MRIRLNSANERESYEEALVRERSCQEEIARYECAVREKDMKRAMSARLKISLFVPPGTYVSGMHSVLDLYGVFGVHCEGRTCTFRVCYVALAESGEFAGEIQYAPLIGDGGFLTPVNRGQYRGPRFVRNGDLLHP